MKKLSTVLFFAGALLILAGALMALILDANPIHPCILGLTLVMFGYLKGRVERLEEQVNTLAKPSINSEEER